VGEYGRRLTPAEHIINGKDKLEQKSIDFEKLQESGLKEGNWDVVFITYVRLCCLISNPV
jgi:oxidoreductase